MTAAAAVPLLLALAYAPALEAHAAVNTPKDFGLNAIMADIVAIVARGSRRAA